jgi:hypothetical protein
LTSSECVQAVHTAAATVSADADPITKRSAAGLMAVIAACAATRALAPVAVTAASAAAASADVAVAPTTVDTAVSELGALAQAVFAAGDAATAALAQAVAPTLAATSLSADALPALSVAAELCAGVAAIAASLATVLPKRTARKKKGDTAPAAADPLVRAAVFERRMVLTVCWQDGPRAALRGAVEAAQRTAKALSTALAPLRKRAAAGLGESAIAPLHEAAFKAARAAVAAKVGAAHTHALSRASMVLDAATAALAAVKLA